MSPAFALVAHLVKIRRIFMNIQYGAGWIDSMQTQAVLHCVALQQCSCVYTVYLNIFWDLENMPQPLQIDRRMHIKIQMYMWGFQVMPF